MAVKRNHNNNFSKIIISPLRKIVRTISPVFYVKCEYLYITKKHLNLKTPTSFTEKLQYLRLYSYPKNELVTTCASRVTVRDYLKENNLETYLIPSYGVFDTVDQINFDYLPNSFVIKCSHASGFNIVVKDKKNLNIAKTKKQLKKWLKTDYGKKKVERHYSNIKPQIIIEEYLSDSLLEYKINVFNGIAKYFYIVSDRWNNIHYNNFYINWEPFNEAQFNGWKTANKDFKKPANWEEMVKIAEILSEKFPFVRVDLYNVNGQIYFGEMTFTPAKGTLKFDGSECDAMLGNWLTI